MSHSGEPPLSRSIAVFPTSKDRRDLERKVLAAAFKLSFERGDTAGASLAHKGLCTILQAQLYDGDGSSSGSVIPASVWSNANQGNASETTQSAAPPVAAKPTEADLGVGRKSYTSGSPAQEKSSDDTSAPVPPVSAAASSNAMPEATASDAKPTAPEGTIDEDQVSITTDSLPVFNPDDDDDVSVTTDNVPILNAAEIEESNEPTVVVPALTASDLDESSEPTVAVAALTPEDLAEFETPIPPIDPREVDAAYLSPDSPPISQEHQQELDEVWRSAFDAQQNPPAEQPEEPYGPISSEIAATLQRLSAAMPPEPEAAAPTQAVPSAGESTINNDAGAQPASALPAESAAPPAPEVLAMPATEPPLFQAPPPELEPMEAVEMAVPPPPVQEPRSEETPSAEQPTGADEPAEPEPNYAQPLTYLDFGDDESVETGSEAIPNPEVIAEMFAQAQAEQAAQEQMFAQAFAEAEASQAIPPESGEPLPDPEAIAQAFAEEQAQASAPAAGETVSAEADDHEDGEQPSQEVIEQMFAAAAQQSAAAPQALTPSQLIKTQTFYQILGVNKLSSYEHIHTKFLRLMRRMLQRRYSATNPIQDMREFRDVVKAICVAHDVLHDPITRTDYDLRQLGMRREQGQLQTPADTGEAMPRTRLMIGELLECANILDRTELQAALDMHKAEPGTLFGTFLVTAGFLNAETLNSALVGQRLISAGKITVAQFQSAMFRMRDHATAFFDTLMVEGWISPADLFKEAGDLMPNMVSETAPAPQSAPAEPPPNPAPAPSADPAISGEHAAVAASAKRAESELQALIKAEDSPD